MTKPPKLPPILVTVDPEIIDEGKRFECEWCPIAIALKRATGKVWSVGTTTASVLSVFHGEGKTWALPRSVVAWINAFDRGDDVKPFTFKLPARCMAR